MLIFAVGAGGFLARYTIGEGDGEGGARRVDRDRELDEAMEAWTRDREGPVRGRALARLVRAGKATLEAHAAWVEIMGEVVRSDPEAEHRSLAASALSSVRVYRPFDVNVREAAVASEMLEAAYVAEKVAAVRMILARGLAERGRDITDKVIVDPAPQVRLAYLEGICVDEDDANWLHTVRRFRRDPDPEVANLAREVLADVHDGDDDPYRS